MLNRLQTPINMLTLLATIGVVVLGLSVLGAAARINVSVIQLAKAMQTDENQRSQFTDILPRLEKILETRAVDHHVRYLLGVSHLTLAQESTGVAQLNTASKQGNQYAQFRLGQWYLQNGDLASARQYLDKSVCNSYHCTNELAHAFYQGGFHEEAIEILEIYLQQSPQNAAAHYQLATMSWGSGDREKTVRAIENALRYDQATTSYKYRYHEARLAYLTRDFRLARSLLTVVTEDFPDKFSATYLLGLTYEHLGELDDAEVALNSAIKLDASHPGARASLARVYQVQQKSDQALAQYRAAIEATTSNSRRAVFLVELIDIYASLNDACRKAETENLLNQLSVQSGLNIRSGLAAIDRRCGN